MKVLDLQGLFAFAVFASLALAILIRHRRLTHRDIGSLFSALMAARTLPVALDLCSFVLPGQRERADIVVPDQYAFYMAAAGLILLVSTCVTICQLFAVRMQRDSMLSAHEDRLQATADLRKSEATAPDQNAETGQGNATEDEGVPAADRGTNPHTSENPKIGSRIAKDR